MSARRSVLAPFPALGAAYVALWVALPGIDVDLDAFDELLAVEGPDVPVMAKHPAAEPAVWALLHAMWGSGRVGHAIRSVQLWNAVWMTVALAAMSASAWRSLRSVVAGPGWILVAAGGYAAMHLALDPYLFYWPPALACVSWALYLGGGGQRFAAVAALLTTALLFNPMCAVALPLAATLWLVRSDRGSRTRAEAVALVLLPAAVLALTLWSADAAGVARGPWGTWTAQTPLQSAKGLADAVLPARHGRRWLGLLQPRLEISFVAGAAVLLLLIAVVVLEAACAFRSQARARRVAPWAVTVVASALMIAWWDPGQRMFWLLPIWLAILGVLDIGDDAGDAAPTGRLRSAAVLALGVTVAAANVAWYAWPSATRADEERIAAENIGRHFTPHDLVVSWTYPDLRLGYFGGVPTRGLFALFLVRRDGESTFDRLRELVTRVQRDGGTVYFAVPTSPEEWAATYERQRVRLDYSERDLERIDWGRTLALEGRTFREIRSVR